MIQRVRSSCVRRALFAASLLLGASPAAAQTEPTLATITASKVAVPADGVTRLVGADEAATYAVFTPNDGAQPQSLLRIGADDRSIAASRLPNPVRVIAAAATDRLVVATAAVSNGQAGECAAQRWDGAAGTLGSPVALDDAPSCAIQLEALPGGTMLLLNRDRGTMFSVDPATMTVEPAQPVGIPEGYQISEFFIDGDAVAVLLSAVAAETQPGTQIATLQGGTAADLRPIERIVGRTPTQVLVIADGAPQALDVATLSNGEPIGETGAVIATADALTWAAASKGANVHLTLSTGEQTLATHDLTVPSDGPIQLRLVATGTRAVLAVTTVVAGKPTTSVTDLQLKL